ncbi:PKD domain-containing protein [Halopiger goleimassiliensis]|uniref:PKD domain-containing protein n=1 Tax=Halopiger goleimassiliensis TaxID=1293048 RepID=UPI000677CB39|nr:PKD domain-containing protein [Halopiger goleimassiliensis]
MSKRTRRTVLKAAGASTLAITAAGCLGGGDGNGDDDNGDGNGDDSTGGGDDEFEISPDETIELEGYTTGWEGTAGDIDGVENPTLVLEEGEEYTIEWTNGDGATHDLQLRNDDDETLEETDDVGDQGESATLEFEASSEMTTYICSYHELQQVGDLVVE